MKLLILLILLSGTVWPQAVSVITSFDGDSGTGGATPTYADHPDVTGPSNGVQVMECDGQGVNVYNTSGSLLKTSTMSAFISAAGLSASTVRDPKCYYYKPADRWIALCSCVQDYMMISTTNDATGTWTGSRLSVISTGDLTMRGAGDKNGFVVCELHTATSFFRVFAIPEADIAAGSLTHINDLGDQSFRCFPAEDLNPSKASNAPMFIVARDGPAQNGTDISINLKVNRVTWSGNTASIDATTLIASPACYSTSQNNSQPTGAVLIKEVESSNVTAAIENGSHLYIVLGSGGTLTGCGGQTNDTLALTLFYDLDTTTLALTTSAKLSLSPQGGANPLSFAFPSINVDGSGNLLVCGSTGGLSQSQSISCFTHRTTDLAGVFNGPYIIATGSQTYTCVNNPVGLPGSYAQATQDPTDTSKLWVTGAYANSASLCAWGTRIVKVAIVQAAAANSVFSGGFTLNGGSIQ